MLITDNTGLRQNEKAKMRKVVIEEDSSEGSDVEFEDDKSKSNGKEKKVEQSKDNSSPQFQKIPDNTNHKIEEIITQKPKDVSVKPTINPSVIRKDEKEVKNDKIYKMTEDEPVLKNSEEIQEGNLQKNHFENLMNSVTNPRTPTQSVNIISVVTTISDLKAQFDRCYSSHNEEKVRASEILKSGDYSRAIRVMKLLIKDINSDETWHAR